MKKLKLIAALTIVFVGLSSCATEDPVMGDEALTQAAVSERIVSDIDAQYPTGTDLSEFVILPASDFRLSHLRALLAINRDAWLAVAKRSGYDVTTRPVR